MPLGKQKATGHGANRVPCCGGDGRVKASVSYAAIALAWVAGASPSLAQTRSEWETPEYHRGGFLDMINAADAYAQGFTGAGVHVGVADTGIDASHPEFIGQLIGGYMFELGVPIVPGRDYDDYGHGTHVSGIVAARRNGVEMHGVAFDAHLTVTDSGSDENGAVPGWRYMADMGVRIVNNSFGLNCDDNDTSCITKDFDRPDVRAEVEALLHDARYAVERGALMVFAAANSSLHDAAIFASMPSLFPDLKDNWLAVAALDPDGSLASYSNWCGLAKDWCVAAPGTAYSTDALAITPSGYVVMDGTSMAAPVVTGVAALVAQAYPWFTARDLQQAVLTTATDLGEAGVDDVYGWGRVNAGKAVRGYGVFVETATLDTKGYSSTFSNDISGPGGLVKLGAGTLTLTGANSYQGASLIREGGLAVDGSVAGPVVAEGAGTLSGRGSVGTARIAAGGTVAPGHSVGTLTVNGEFVQEAGGTYAFEFAGGGADQIRATGQASLGGTLALIPVDTDFRIGTAYQAVLADGGVAGGFSGILQPSPYLSANVSLAGNAANVTLVQARSFAEAGATANERSAGGGLDTLTPGALQNRLLLLPSDAAVAAALPSFTATIGPSAKGVMVEDSRFLRGAVFDRLTSAGAAPAAEMEVATLGATSPAAAPGALWARGFGSWGSTDATAEAAGLDRDTGGFLIGGDALLGDGALGGWRLGLLGGYSRTSFDGDADAASGEVGTIHLGAYAGRDWEQLRLRLGAAYGWNDIETGRSAAFPEAQRLTADYDGDTTQAFGELGYGLKAGTVDFEPFAGLAYVNVATDGYTEQGGPAALAASADTTEVTYSTLGLRAAVALTGGTTTTTLRGMLGWRHAFGDVTPTSSYRVATGSLPFAIAGVPVAENALVLDLGVDVSLTDRMKLGVSYGGQFGDGAQDQSVGGSLTWRF